MIQVQVTPTDSQGWLLQDWVHFWRNTLKDFKSKARDTRTEGKMSVPEKEAAVLSLIPPKDITLLTERLISSFLWKWLQTTKVHHL